MFFLVCVLYKHTIKLCGSIMFHNQHSQLLHTLLIRIISLLQHTWKHSYAEIKIERVRRRTHHVLDVKMCVCITSLWFLHSTDEKVTAFDVKVITNIYTTLQPPFLKKGIEVWITVKVIIKPMFSIQEAHHLLSQLLSRLICYLGTVSSESVDTVLKCNVAKCLAISCKCCKLCFMRSIGLGCEHWHMEQIWHEILLNLKIPVKNYMCM